MSMSLEIKGCRCSYLYASTHLAKYTFNITKVTNNMAQSYEKKKKLVTHNVDIYAIWYRHEK